MISEILSGHAHDSDLARLKRHLDEISKSFNTGNKENFPAPEELGYITLWVAGYAVTNEQVADGILGNWMTCFIDETPSGFVARAERVERDGHPIRGLGAERKVHPNDSCRAIRFARKERRFRTEGEILALLDELKRDYPLKTIRPLPGKAYTIIWERGRPRKVVLKVRYSPEGEWYLQMLDNHFRPDEKNATPDNQRVWVIDRYSENLNTFVLTTLSGVLRGD